MNRVSRLAAAASIMTLMLVAVPSASEAVPLLAPIPALEINQPTLTFNCQNSGWEQFPAATLKVELVATYPGKSPEIVGLAYSPFAKDPARCTDPRFPYLFSVSWTPTQAGVVPLKFCLSLASNPGVNKCLDLEPVTVTVPAAVVPAAPAAPVKPTAPAKVRCVNKETLKIKWFAGKSCPKGWKPWQ